MSLIATVLADLRRDEGLRLRSYQDGGGVWTLGYGHTRGIADGVTCTQEQAEAWLMSDAMDARAALDANAPWWANEPVCVQRGLWNMAFNLGWPRLSKFEKMLAALREARYADAADEALASKWAGQVGDRATRIAGLFRGASSGVA